jgi:hypothetical protein
MKLFAVALVVLAVLLTGVTGCIGNAPGDIHIDSVCHPTDYHNGVFYFPCKGQEFGDAIAKFIADNANGNQTMQVCSISGDGSGFYGSDTGEYVLMKWRC